MAWLPPTPEQTEAAFAALLAGPVVAPLPDEADSPADLPLLLRLANARVEEQIRQSTEATGLRLTPAAVHVLRVCRVVEKPLGSIAEHLQVSRQAAFQVVNRLAAEGLVERTATGRAARVGLTDEGHAVVREVTAVLTEVIHDWLVQLREGRLRQLCADLEVLSERPGARWRQLGD